MSITQEPFSRLLLGGPAVGGGTPTRQISRRIVERKRRAPASPDSAYGLTLYFIRATDGKWGQTNIPALCHEFSELLKSGQITPNQGRAMVDRFVNDWKFYPTHTKAAWETFIGRRKDLMEKTKDQKKTSVEKSSEWAEITAKYAVPRRQEAAPNDNE